MEICKYGESIESGLYEMTNYPQDNTKVLIKVKTTPKNIIFELISERPFLSYGDIDKFIYDCKRRVVNKSRAGHGIVYLENGDFVLYPFQCGLPYHFKKLEQKLKI